MGADPQLGDSRSKGKGGKKQLLAAPIPGRLRQVMGEVGRRVGGREGL